MTRDAAAHDAGMSTDRKKQPLQIATIPAAVFEAAVDAPRAPSIKALADQGKASTAHLRGRDPKEFARATEAQGHLRRFAEFAEAMDPAMIAR